MIRDSLYTAWVRHHREAGHPGDPDRGTGAKYNQNFAGTYIECGYPSCRWRMKEQEA
jgi:hypothetical protein